MHILLLFLLLITSPTCSTPMVSSVEPYQVNDPKESYRKAFYRRTVEIFEKNPSLAKTHEDYYIWSSAYFELHEYQKSLTYLRKIDGEKLLQDENTKLLHPFYVQKYINVLIEINDKEIVEASENQKIIAAVNKIPRTSPMRYKIDQSLFSVLWKTKDYQTMLTFTNNLSPEGEAWLELAKHALNQKYNLNKILNAHQSLGLAYANVVREISLDSIRDKNQLKQLTEMNLALKTSETLNFAKKYAQISNDKEYEVTIHSLLLQKQGNNTDSAKLLYQYIQKNPKSSKNLYTLTHKNLVRRKLFEEADTIALMAKDNYNLDFYLELPSSIEYLKDLPKALNWYKTSAKKLSEEAHNQIIRSFIRADLNKAEQLAEVGLEFNQDNPTFILNYALIKQHQGKLEDAYKTYMKLIFTEAFRYSGIVARKKEKELRPKFRSLFEQTLSDLKNKLPSYKLEDRLMIMKSLLLDPEMATIVDIDQMKKDQKEFNKIVLTDLEKSPLIPELEKLPQSITNYSVELEQLINLYTEKALGKTADFHDKARVFYRYRNLFLNSNMEGYLTFRLYFYVRDQYGYGKFLNYPKEVIDLIFQKPKWELIQKYSGDEDMSYWMLASFMAESHFRKRVRSSVGAVGFAQVMPYTAVDIKRWMKKPEFTNYDFYDNLRMGIYYHYRMYEMMGDIVLSLAAYNAGPNAVKRWVNEYPHIKDQDLFVEAIPYKETRNYVRIIAYNYQMYQIVNKYSDILFP